MIRGSHDFHDRRWWMRYFGWFIIPMQAVIAIVIIFSSCATKTKIEYRDLNNYVMKDVHDTLTHVQHDSVWVEIVTKKDTVFYTKYKERIEYRESIVEHVDTCWNEKVVTKYEEKVVKQTKIPKIFWISFVFSIIVIIFATLKLVKWLRTRWDIT